MSLQSLVLFVLFISNNLAQKKTTSVDQFLSALRGGFIPALQRKLNPTYLLLRPLVIPEEQYIYDEWGPTDSQTHRPVICRLIVISKDFVNVSKDDADTPEEWNQFKANNDFDENKGQVDLRVRSKKRSTVISPQDAELRVKIYKYLKMHFDPLHLHVVDSKDQHPVDNDNPAFDVLIVSNKFNNLTITQRTVLVHDYLRDYINEGIQFRLHSLQSPEEVYPDRFNIDGFETAAFVQVLDIHKYINPYRIYEPPPKHVVHLNNLLINNQSVIADAKKKLREWDQKRLKEKEAG